MLSPDLRPLQHPSRPRLQLEHRTLSPAAFESYKLMDSLPATRFLGHPHALPVLIEDLSLSLLALTKLPPVGLSLICIGSK